MVHMLLAIIYLAFISLGLPDSLLGSAWPSMHQEISLPVSYAGGISMIIAASTILSSLQCDRLTRKIDTGRVTTISVFLTAATLFGFSVSHSHMGLCLWAVPYGLGAGCVDASLNNYVALHYASRHMSWLHCMWGVGASIGPYIMGAALSDGRGWNMGYRSIALIGVQMAASYAGTCIMPPVFGLFANYIGAYLFPWYLLLVLALMILMHEKLLHKTKDIIKT